jgi:hypothetical protein
MESTKIKFAQIAASFEIKWEFYWPTELPSGDVFSQKQVGLS